MTSTRSARAQSLPMTRSQTWLSGLGLGLVWFKSSQWLSPLEVGGIASEKRSVEKKNKGGCRCRSRTSGEAGAYAQASWLDERPRGRGT